MPSILNINPYWKAIKAYANVYRLEYRERADKCFLIGATAEADVTINLPFGTRLVKIEVIAMDASYALSPNTVPFGLTLQRKLSKISNLPYHFTTIWKIDKSASIVGSEFVKHFGETFEYEPTTFTLTLYGSDTNLISVVPYIQIEGGI